MQPNIFFIANKDISILQLIFTHLHITKSIQKKYKQSSQDITLQ